MHEASASYEAGYTTDEALAHRLRCREDFFLVFPTRLASSATRATIEVARFV